MIAAWLAVLVVCVAGTGFASKKAVDAALALVEASRFSPALVGLTVMSIGTDLPEIANSIISTASDHGDVNVGDSIGSVVTQVTLVLGILCIASPKLSADRNFIVGIGAATFFATVSVWVFVRDGEIGRLDALVLVVFWLGGTALFGQSELRPRETTTTGITEIWSTVASVLLWLSAVGAFAVGVVQSFLAIAEVLGVPEFVGSFIALSLGTSLPELAVDSTAIRRGATSMAVGDIFGSSFVDATLSVAIGPLIFSSVISSEVQSGVAFSATAVALATVLTARSAKRLDWRLGAALILLYSVVQLSVAFSGT